MSETEKIIIEEIFTDKDVEEIWKNENPISFTSELLETYFRKTTGNIDVDTQLILATSEFHVNNLIFLKENFTLTWGTYAKLLNLLAVMLNLTDGERSEDVKLISPTDLDLVLKNKLRELKKGLLQLNLIQSPNITHGKGEAIKPSDTVLILEYLHTSFFNFVQLYYFFANVKRKVTREIKEVIINLPTPVPPLIKATKIEKPKEKVEEKVEVKKEVIINLLNASNRMLKKKPLLNKLRNPKKKKHMRT